MKKKQGKKKLPKEKQKTKLVQARVSASEYAELLQIAENIGVDYVSAVFRIALRNFVTSQRS